MGCGASSHAPQSVPSLLERRKSSASSPLRERYQSFDIDGDGAVSKYDMRAKILQDEEFQALLVAAGRLKKPQDTEGALHIIETTRRSSELFDFDSFKKLAKKTTTRRLFDEIDLNGDGVLSNEELQEKIDRDYDVQELLHAKGADGYQYVKEQIDKNGDGIITWEEFKSALEASSHGRAD